MAGRLKVNGRSFQVADDAGLRAETAWSLEVEGSSSAELRLLEADQTYPAGRWRVLASGDALVIQRAKRQTSTDDWTEATTLLTLEADGATITFSEDGFINLLEQLILWVASGSLVGIRLRELLQELRD